MAVYCASCGGPNPSNSSECVSCRRLANGTATHEDRMKWAEPDWDRELYRQTEEAHVAHFGFALSAGPKDPGPVEPEMAPVSLTPDDEPEHDSEGDPIESEDGIL